MLLIFKIYLFLLIPIYLFIQNMGKWFFDSYSRLNCFLYDTCAYTKTTTENCVFIFLYMNFVSHQHRKYMRLGCAERKCAENTFYGRIGEPRKNITFRACYKCVWFVRLEKHLIFCIYCSVPGRLRSVVYYSDIFIRM